jgi:hypothetical protein
MSRIEEIRGTMLTKMKEYDIEPSTENQLAALQHLQVVLSSDERKSIDNSLNKVAVIAEINTLKMKRMFS